MRKPLIGFNGVVSAQPEVEGSWEYAPLRIPADVGRTTAAAQLSLHAEFGGWELATVQRYEDGTRRVTLRRKRRPGNADVLPLPVLPL